jgi:hypothetical protein
MADTTYKNEHAAAQHGVLGTIAAGGEDNVADHKQSSHGVHSELLAGGKEAIDDHKRAVHGTLSTIAAGGESAVLDHKQAANAVLGDVAAGSAEHRANHEAALKAIHDALPKRPARPDGLELVGAGPGGISEMQALVKDDEMYFGLLVFTVGSGTFMRHKLVNVHFQGEGMSAIKRGRILARRKVATDILKNTHAAVQFVQQSDVTLDFVISHLGKFFAADHGDHDIDVGKIKEDYEAMIAATKVAQLSLNKQSTRKTARDFKAKPSGKQVLEWVHAESAKDGPFNWALFEPNKKKLEFFNAGSLSVDEMLNDLDPKKVLAGILRMSFGTGRFKRTKWIAIWWSGEEVSAVQRGKLNAMKGAMTKMLAPYTLIHTAQTAGT